MLFYGLPLKNTSRHLLQGTAPLILHCHCKISQVPHQVPRQCFFNLYPPTTFDPQKCQYMKYRYDNWSIDMLVLGLLIIDLVYFGGQELTR